MSDTQHISRPTNSGARPDGVSAADWARRDRDRYAQLLMELRRVEQEIWRAHSS